MNTGKKTKTPRSTSCAQCARVSQNSTTFGFRKSKKTVWLKLENLLAVLRKRTEIKAVTPSKITRIDGRIIFNPATCRSVSFGQDSACFQMCKTGKCEPVHNLFVANFDIHMPQHFKDEFKTRRVIGFVWQHINNLAFEQIALLPTFFDDVSCYQLQSPLIIWRQAFIFH